MSEAQRNATELLGVRDLRIEIGARVLLKTISFQVRRGETWCVLGPNGSGKSTLLHVLAGLREVQKGAVVLSGRPCGEWSLRDAARIRGLLLQSQADAFSATVLETVLIGRHPHIGRFGWESPEDRESALRALENMSIASLKARDVTTLSGGERQRVALAAVLAQDPALFILDEPTAHLDLAHQAALFRHLEGLTRDAGRAVIFATHDYNLASRFATHALCLIGDGEARAGPADSLLDAPRLSELFGFALASVPGSEARAYTPLW